MATSALLTLDVAAVAAASVGIAVAGDQDEERRWHLGGAILGANVGSLLLAFSNLTNLVLVSASGIGFAAYVGLAIWPQVAAAIAVGVLFALPARRGLGDPAGPGGDEAPGFVGTDTTPVPEGTTRLAGSVAVIGAVAAVVAGLKDGNMAVPFAVSAGTLAGVAVATGRLAIRAMLRSIPLAGVAVIGIAAIASGPMGTAAGWLPRPDATPRDLLFVAAVGGLVAALANNLPAAAFGGCGSRAGTRRQSSPSCSGPTSLPSPRPTARSRPFSPEPSANGTASDSGLAPTSVLPGATPWPVRSPGCWR